MSFNWVDLLLVLVVVLSAIGGWRRGVIMGFFDLVRWLGSWFLALVFYQPLSSALTAVTTLEDTWRNPLAFVIILFTVSLVLRMIEAKATERLPKDIHERNWVRALGIIPGIVSGMILAAILAALLFAMPLSDSISEAARESYLANRLAEQTEDLEAALVPVFDPAVRRSLNRLTTVEPGTNETVELPFTVTEMQPMPSLEAEMLDLINQERTSRGLNALESDPEMREVAIKHSVDMFERRYFSHVTPDGKDPFDRMRDMDVRFRTAGENLALAPTLQIAHTGLMNSPGHRANILRPQFGRVGIGIIRGGRHGLMVTQKFRN